MWHLGVMALKYGLQTPDPSFFSRQVCVPLPWILVDYDCLTNRTWQAYCSASFLKHEFGIWYWIW